MTSDLKENFLNIWDRLGEWVLYAALLILPVFSLPYTIFPVELNKSYLTFFLIILSGILYLSSILRTGEFSLSKNLLYPLILLLVVIFATSSFFSMSSHVSWTGLGYEPGSFNSFVFFALVLFLASLLINEEAKSIKVFIAVFSSIAILFVLQVFQSIFNVELFSWIGSAPTASVIGSWNELGIFSSLVLLMSLIFFDFLPSSGLKVFAGVVGALAFFLTAFVNFMLIWWVLGVFLIIFIAYLYSRTRSRSGIFRAPLLFLLLVILFIVVRPLGFYIVNSLGISFIEVKPSWSATLQIVWSAVKENPVLGSGPNTFVYDWFKYRPHDVVNSPLWQVRVNTGVGFLPTLIQGVGISGGLLLIAFLLFFIWYGFKSLVVEPSKISFLLIASFVGALYLWVFAVIYPVGFFLMFMAFLFTGMFLGLATASGIIDSIKISLFERTGQSFISALVLIFLMVLGLSWLYVLGKNYYGAYRYGIAVEALSRGNYDRSADNLERAIKYSPKDRYYRTFTDIKLIKVQEIVVMSGVPNDERAIQFRDRMGAAVEVAQKAIDLNPADPFNWSNKGRVYEAIVPLRISDSVPAISKFDYEESFKRFPTSPEAYFAIARVELAQGKINESREFLKKAIAIKKDFAPAYFLTAQIEAQSGNLDGAIRSTEIAAALSSEKDIGVLFQLGLLYYQAQRLDEARAAFEQAIKANRNYANARYFLGLIYYMQGNPDASREQFKKIAELNPNNGEVRLILANLSQGKPPLDGISPPGPQPEKRKNLPIEESSQ